MTARARHDDPEREPTASEEAAAEERYHGPGRHAGDEREADVDADRYERSLDSCMP